MTKRPRTIDQRIAARANAAMDRPAPASKSAPIRVSSCQARPWGTRWLLATLIPTLALIMCFGPSRVAAQTVHESWDAGKFYYVGDSAAANGRLWSAQVDHMGISPTSPGQIEWLEVSVLEDGVPVFDIGKAYSANDVVAFDGGVWRALYNTVGEEPGNSGGWNYIRSYSGNTTLPKSNVAETEASEFVELLTSEATYSSQWTEVATYSDPAERVVYNTMGWTVSEDGLLPPVGNAPLAQGCFWELIDVPSSFMPAEWERGTSYALGALVSHEGLQWLSVVNSASSTPGRGSTNWLAVAPNVAATPSWRLGERVEAGDIRLYSGGYWINVTGLNSTEPGNTFTQGASDWIRFSKPTGASPIYEVSFSDEIIMPRSGLLFSLDGNFWISRQVNNLMEPPSINEGGWLSVSASEDIFCDLFANQESTVDYWNAATVYDTVGTIVIYGEDYYYNLATVFGANPPPSDTVNWAPVAAEVQAGSGLNQGASEWQSGTVYSQGVEVFYEDRSWVALYGNSGQAPGFSGAWQPVTLTDGEAWNAYFIYNAQSIVSYNGQLWQNSSYVQGDVPGLSSVWVAQNDSELVDIADGLPWDATLIYDDSRSYTVTHSGRTWYNIEETQNEEPGTTQAWQPQSFVSEEDWNQYFIYDMEGTIVTHAGDLWASLYYTTGDEPGESLAWEQINSDDVVNDAWDESVTYDTANTVVEYGGRTWYNSYPTTGDEPGASDAWQPTALVDSEAWNTHFIYADPSTRVTYDGVVWQNLSYSQGHIPSQSDLWVIPEEASSWSANTTYSITGTEVVHLDRTWHNRWSTTGDEPGASEVWQPTDIAAGEDWNTYFIYETAGTRVAHNGGLWQNQWWSQYEEPGNSINWIVVSDSSGGGELWDVNTYYAAGAEVFHESRYWISQEWTLGVEPGTTVAWQPKTIEEGEDWNELFIYQTPGTIVAYAGTYWTNSDSTQGEIPGQAAVWTEVDDDDGSGDGGSGDGDTDNDGDTDDDIPAWDANTTYQVANTEVTYDGRVWYNRYWADAGIVPGTDEVWQPKTLEDYEDWNPYFIYNNDGITTFGTIVLYDGREWLNQWNTQGEVPGTTGVTVWVPLDGGDVGGDDDALAPWDVNLTYSTGDLVSHDGREWECVVATTSGIAPGLTAHWQPVSITVGEAWNEFFVYASGTQVSYDDRLWTSLEAIDPNSDPETPKPYESSTWQPDTIISGEDWNQYFIYAAGTQVTFDERLWTSESAINPRSDADLAKPYESAEWQPNTLVDGENWNQFFSYEAEIIVFHNDSYWKSNAASQGDEPGTSNVWSATTDDGSAPSWDTNITYFLGDEVEYDDRVWISQGQTQGDEPGASDSWQPEKIVSGEAWNQYFVYESGTQVSFDDRLWTSQSDIDPGQISPTPKPYESREWQPNTILDGEAWNAYFSYEVAGIVVAHANGYWASNRASENEEPGTSNAWSATTDDGSAPIWDMTITYFTDDQVEYSDRVWISQKQNQGQEPGASDAWQPETISSGEEWNAYFIYAEGTQVTFDSRLWTSESDIDPTSGSGVVKPYDSALWQPNTIMNGEAWNQYFLYGAETIVFYDGGYWQSNLDSQGDVPGTSAVWSATTDNGSAADWDVSITYNTGDEAYYDQRVWISQRQTTGETPGFSDAWQPETLISGEAWNEFFIYPEGAQVTFDQRLWTSEAAINPTSGSGIVKPYESALWQPNALISGEAWNQFFIYEIGDIVFHATGYWQSNQDAPNDEPGTSSIWSPIGIDGGTPAWDASVTYYTGDEVEYNAREWISQGQTVGELPGGAYVWQPKTIVSGEAWNEYFIYPAGTQVSFDNRLWTSQVAIDPDEVSPTPKPYESWDWQPNTIVDGDPWNAYFVYAAETQVLHAQRYWTSQWVSDQGDEPGLSTVWQPDTLVDGDEWSEFFSYEAGHIVRYNNAYWRSRWLTQNQIPGQTDAWAAATLDGSTPAWDANITYLAGDEVDYNTRDWISRRDTLGDTPGETDAWQPETISNGEAWNQYFVYPAEIQVVYNSRNWISQWQTEMGDEPSFDAVWQPETFIDGDPWNVTFSYVADIIVLYNNAYWQSRSTTQGDVPGETDAWRATTIDGGAREWDATLIYAYDDQVLYSGMEWRANATSTSGVAPGATEDWQPLSITSNQPWNAFYIYSDADTVVSHNGRDWINSAYVEANVAPGTSTDWQPVSIEVGENWNQHFIYDDAGYLVLYNGTYWESRYYTQGDIPGETEAWAASTLDGSAPSWRASITYLSGDEVEYNGRGWISRRETLGDTPGQTDAWQPETIFDGEAWNPYFVYEGEAKVVHNLRNWTSQWQTEMGDEPGFKDVWQPDTFVQGDDWNATFAYGPDIIVLHNGSYWISRWNTQNQEPGVSGDWAATTLTGETPEWDATLTYVFDDRVMYNGTEWACAAQTTTGLAPGATADWQPLSIGEGDPWNQHFIYSEPGTVVSHNGRTWTNSAYLNPGVEPGQSEDWQPTEILDGEEWNQYFKYETIGTRVTYLGQFYTNQRVAWPGDVPGVADVWVLESTDDGTSQGWNASTIYFWNDQVEYSEYDWGEQAEFEVTTWICKTGSVDGISGSAPGTVSDWWPESIPNYADWNPNFTYETSGTRVIHNGQTWVNSWWSGPSDAGPADEPGVSNTGTWVLAE